MSAPNGNPTLRIQGPYGLERALNPNNSNAMGVNRVCPVVQFTANSPNPKRMNRIQSHFFLKPLARMDRIRQYKINRAVTAPQINIPYCSGLLPDIVNRLRFSRESEMGCTLIP